MNLFKRIMIFATFFGCCISIVLQAAAIGTEYWVVADAIRLTNNGSRDTDSGGRINFGLFAGRKELNYGYGERGADIDVVSVASEERELMLYGLWMATIACLAGGILFGCVAAIFAVVNTATTPVEAVTGVAGLYVWNLLALFFNLGTLVTWVVQYSLRLRFNVLNREDRSSNWTSKHMATFGFSFWLVVGAIFCHLINILLVMVGTRRPRDKTKMVPVQEKTNGAIMLY